MTEQQSDQIGETQQNDTSWSSLPRPAKAYVIAVMAIGTTAFGMSLPRTLDRPGLFALLLVVGLVTSIWKVNLPIPLASGSTLSVSYAANLMSLLLLGPRAAMVIGVVGVCAQCTFNVRRAYPLYRTLFSAASEALTMLATGAVYVGFGGSFGPFDLSALPKPLVGAIATYFAANTGMVATAIGLSTGRTPLAVWLEDFLWSGVSFIVAGTAGALSAIVIDRGDHWKAVLLFAPVYLTYRTYQIFIGRLEDQRRHLAVTRKLHEDAVNALERTQRAERELAEEKERLARALGEMTRLEEMRNQLLGREQEARASAEQANRSKDQFLAIVSHELRTPLNAVLGWAQMLRNGSLDSVRSGRAVHAIYHSARRQAQLIEELLDSSRIMSGKLQLERSTISWDETVRGALEVVQPAAHAKWIEIGVDIDPAIGAFHGDGPRLQQIVWNLLTNAVKFTPNGGSVDLQLRRVGDVVELSVTDSGQGIPRDFLPRVFDPFVQADGTTTRRHGGLGLGLSIVKHLVEAHGGAIKAESEGEGRGATFIVRLPIAPVYVETLPPSMDDARRTVDQRSVLPSLEGISVLVVDDDDGSREMVAAFLEDRHAAVMTASSAKQALELVQRERVDVMLADIAMPDEDGYELVRKLRAMRTPSTANIPVAALTAFARDEERQQALDAGFQMHLTKPVDLSTLVNAVTILGRSSSSTH